jgi:rRNA pseudouridine-1189 N-methylase Emg1 (Nep1/Mra1 family)
MKIVQALVLVSSLVAASAYAQSSMRPNEIKNHPEQYRLGDSSDMQEDQMIVDQNKVHAEKGKLGLSSDQQEILLKHLMKSNI